MSHHMMERQTPWPHFKQVRDSSFKELNHYVWHSMLTIQYRTGLYCIIPFLYCPKKRHLTWIIQVALFKLHKISSMRLSILIICSDVLWKQYWISLKNLLDLCSESISGTSSWLLYRDIRNPYTQNMMYGSVAVEVTVASDLCRLFFYKNRKAEEKYQASKLRIIYTFQPVEKVTRVRQLKKETIRLYQGRQLVFVACYVKVNWLKYWRTFGNFHPVCFFALPSFSIFLSLSSQ